MAEPQDLPEVLAPSYTGAVTAYQAWKKADATQHAKARAMLAEIYCFAQTCFANPDDFEAFCSKNKIKVRKDAAANRYIRIVKAVIGEFVPAANKKSKDAWVADDLQTNKYANILFFAEKKQVEEQNFSLWLAETSEQGGGGTITAANQRAIDSKLLPQGKTSRGSTEKLEAGRKVLTETWQASFQKAEVDGDLLIRIDRNAAGVAADAKRVELVADIDDDGTITILGLARKTPDTINRDIRALVPSAEEENAQGPYATLFEIVRLAEVFNGTTPTALIENSDDGLRVSLGIAGGSGSPVATISSETKDEGLPEGKWVLTGAALEALSFAKRQCGGSAWSVTVENNVPVVRISPADGLTIQEFEDKKFAERIKRWQAQVKAAADRGRKQPKRPTHFKRAEGLKNTKSDYYVTFTDPSIMTDVEMPHIKDWAQKGDVSFPISKPQREEVKKAVHNLSDGKKPLVLASVRENGFNVRSRSKPAGTPCVGFKANVERPIEMAARPSELEALFRVMNSLSDDPGQVKMTGAGMLVEANGGSHLWQFFLPALVGDDYTDAALISKPL